MGLEAAYSAIEYPPHSFKILAASTAAKKALTYSLICAGTSRPSTFGSQQIAAQKNGTTLKSAMDSLSPRTNLPLRNVLPHLAAAALYAEVAATWSAGGAANAKTV